jgi:large subunit ribosomal protein L25
MENILKLSAESRTEVGKKISKQLRKNGKIPAIIYGLDKDSVPISIILDDIKGVMKAEKGMNSLLRIEREGAEPVDAMLKEVQWDYLSDHIIHADLIRIDLNKPVVVHVPIRITGEAIGVKVEDGIFDFIVRAVDVRCMPAKIPTEIVVDVSELHSGQSLKVEELEENEELTYVTDPSVVICLVAKKGGAAESEEEEGEGEEGEEVEETPAD